VEPATIPCKEAEKKGIETINSRFEDAVASILRKTDNNIKLITGFNVLAHTDDLHGFLQGIVDILNQNPGAVFVNQSHYLPEMIEGVQYDTIYHEHARYYSLSALTNIFDNHDLVTQDAELVDFYGQSILVYTGLNGEPSMNVKDILDEEEPYRSLDKYRDFSEEVKDIKGELIEIIREYIKRGSSVVGIGAPMKSSTLLNYCGIDTDLLDYVTERNEFKIGKYTPGTHIPVKTDDDLLRDDPEAALILSWNVAPRIMESLKDQGFTGDFIIPLPNPHVIEN
jgi:hypothetical protein